MINEFLLKLNTNKFNNKRIINNIIGQIYYKLYKSI